MSVVKNKKNGIYFVKFLTILSMFLIPFFICLLIIIMNNFNKIDNIFKFLVCFSLVLFIVLFILGLLTLKKNKKLFNKRKTFVNVCFLFVLYAFVVFSTVKLIYYNEEFKSFIITSSLSSINYKDVAKSIYDDSIVDEVVKDNFKLVNLDDDIINFGDIKYKDNIYLNEYEKEILEHNKDEVYKIINISGNTIGKNYHYEGYIAVIYNPALVKVAKSTGAGTFEGSYGETLETISRKNNALVAINAGGFYDPNWNSNGGIPHGDVIIDGVIDSSYVRGDVSGGLIGFDKNNKLVLKNMTGEEALSMGIRDAVDWGPFLITNGINHFKHVNYHTWNCARTAIGQRKDGIVLMVVIDGLQSHSAGVSYADMANIMEKYGAINAANLDGGTSTAMVVNGKYINSPWNGHVKTYRWLPNAFIVKR